MKKNTLIIKKKCITLSQEDLDVKLKAHQDTFNTNPSLHAFFYPPKKLDLSEKEIDGIVQFYKANRLKFPKDISYNRIPFSGSVFTDCDFSSIDPNIKKVDNRATYISAIFSQCDLSFSKFAYSKLNKAVFIDTIMNQVDLTKTNLTDAILIRAKLKNAILIMALLQFTNFTDANLTDADMTDADMRNAILIRVNLTNAILKNAELTKTNLTDADMTDADMTDTVQIWANLTRTNLTRANLTDANLRETTLTTAILKNAILIRTNLTDADMSDADMSDTVQIWANLRRANLTRANMEGAVLFNTKIWFAQLSVAADFDQCFIDTTTLENLGIENRLEKSPFFKLSKKLDNQGNTSFIITPLTSKECLEKIIKNLKNLSGEKVIREYVKQYDTTSVYSFYRHKFTEPYNEETIMEGKTSIKIVRPNLKSEIVTDFGDIDIYTPSS